MWRVDRASNVTGARSVRARARAYTRRPAVLRAYAVLDPPCAGGRARAAAAAQSWASGATPAVAPQRPPMEGQSHGPCAEAGMHPPPQPAPPGQRKSEGTVLLLVHQRASSCEGSLLLWLLSGPACLQARRWERANAHAENADPGEGDTPLDCTLRCREPGVGHRQGKRRGVAFKPVGALAAPYPWCASSSDHEMAPHSTAACHPSAWQVMYPSHRPPPEGGLLEDQHGPIGGRHAGTAPASTIGHCQDRATLLLLEHIERVSPECFGCHVCSLVLPAWGSGLLALTLTH